MEAAATMSDRYSLGELRVSHDQNLVLPWVREADLRAVWHAAQEAGFATPNIGLLTDMISCPGGDLCALANARSIPIAAAITEHFDDLDALLDLGDIDLHMSGCMNSCGHHHTGHIGILGIDKDGAEWYQVSVGGSDGSTLSGASVPGQGDRPVVRSRGSARPSMQALIDTFRDAARRQRALRGYRTPYRHRAVPRCHRRRCAAKPPSPPESEEAHTMKFIDRSQGFLDCCCPTPRSPAPPRTAC